MVTHLLNVLKKFNNHPLLFSFSTYGCKNNTEFRLLYYYEHNSLLNNNRRIDRYLQFINNNINFALLLTHFTSSEKN